MHLALYQPDIAQNLGTSLRTAACLGANVHIIEPCGFPLDDRKLRRSGMDYINHVKYSRHSSWDHFTKWAKENNSRIILLSSKTQLKYTEFEYQESDILLLGRETAGVPEGISNQCENKVTIPMQENMRSLNVAISAAIVLSEAIRQLSL